MCTFGACPTEVRDCPPMGVIRPTLQKVHRNTRNRASLFGNSQENPTSQLNGLKNFWGKQRTLAHPRHPSKGHQSVTILYREVRT